MSELDRNATVARLQAGKKVHRERGERVEGRWPYGESPHVKHLGERDVVARIHAMQAAGTSVYQIAKILNSEGITTRYGKSWRITTVQNILSRKR
jgi:site-specific DNA recombinase